MFVFRGPPRRPPPQIQEQVKTLNQSLRLGHLLCRSRNPDFLLNIIQRQVMDRDRYYALQNCPDCNTSLLLIVPKDCLCVRLTHNTTFKIGIVSQKAHHLRNRLDLDSNFVQSMLNFNWRKPVDVELFIISKNIDED